MEKYWTKLTSATPIFKPREYFQSLSSPFWVLPKAVLNPWSTSKAHIQPLRVLSKPIFKPSEYFLSLSSTSGSTSKAHFHPLSTSKGCFQPTEYLQGPISTLGSTSKADLHPFEHFQKLSSSQGVLPKPIFNPWEYYQSPSSTPWKCFQRSNDSFGSHQHSSIKFSTQANHGWTFSSMLSKTNLHPLESTPKARKYMQRSKQNFLKQSLSQDKASMRPINLSSTILWLPNIFFNPWVLLKPIFNPMKVLPKV